MNEPIQLNLPFPPLEDTGNGHDIYPSLEPTVAAHGIIGGEPVTRSELNAIRGFLAKLRAERKEQV